MRELLSNGAAPGVHKQSIYSGYPYMDIDCLSPPAAALLLNNPPPPC